jgi:hypothetical protein
MDVRGGPDEALGVDAAPELALVDAPRRRAGSRPLSSGGALPEFTAYAPALTPTMAATTCVNSLGNDPAPLAGGSLTILPFFRQNPKRNPTIQPRQISCEYGQRWEPILAAASP